MCHLVLLLPVLALPLFWWLPPLEALPAYAVVLILSGWIYYYIMAALRRPVQIGPERLLQQGGIVEFTTPSLRVRVDGDSWSAESRETLAAGDAVVVEAVEGLKLVVRKAGAQGHEAQAVQAFGPE